MKRLFKNSMQNGNSIKMLKIQSNNNPRFKSSLTFNTVSDASYFSDIPVRIINSIKKTQKPLTRRDTGYMYNIT